MTKTFSPRCVCCNALIDYSYLSDPDLCATCSVIVRKAIKDDNFIRPDHVLADAREGVTPVRKSGYE